MQVKGTGGLNRGRYDVQPVYSSRGEGKTIYAAEEIDDLAAHVVVDGEGCLVFAAGRGVCRDEEFAIFSGLEEQESAMGAVPEGLGLAGSAGGVRTGEATAAVDLRDASG